MKKLNLLMMLFCLLSFSKFVQCEQNEEAKQKKLTKQDLQQLQAFEIMATYFGDQEVLDQVNAIKKDNSLRFDDESLDKIHYWSEICRIKMDFFNMNNEEKEKFVQSILSCNKHSSDKKDVLNYEQLSEAIDSFDPRYYYELSNIVEKDDLEAFIQWFDVKRINKIQIIYFLSGSHCPFVIGTIGHLAIIRKAKRILTHLLSHGLDATICNNFGYNIKALEERAALFSKKEIN